MSNFVKDIPNNVYIFFFNLSENSVKGAADASQMTGLAVKFPAPLDHIERCQQSTELQVAYGQTSTLNGGILAFNLATERIYMIDIATTKTTQ